MDKEILLGRLKKQMVGTDEQIERFAALCFRRRRDSKALQRSFAALHKVHGARHSQKGWGVSAATSEERWVFIHTVAIDLAHMGFRFVAAKGLRERHIIALCHFWEAQGLAPTTLIKKKSMLKTLYLWANKKGAFEKLTNKDLFTDFKPLTKVKETLEEKIELDIKDSEWTLTPDLYSAKKLESLMNCGVFLEGVSAATARRYIALLGLMYWFGLSEKQGGEFMYEDVVLNDSKVRPHILTRQYNELSQTYSKQRVFLDEEEQFEFLNDIKSSVPKNESLIAHVHKKKCWTKAFRSFARKNDLPTSKVVRGFKQNRAYKQSEQMKTKKKVA